MTITLATTVYYPSPVRVDEIERACGCVVPPELLEFWRLCGGARVFEDVLNGQWGFLLWTPVEVAVRSPDDTSSWDQYRPGDLVIGGLIGDLERVLVRADPDQDSSSIVIAPKLDLRPDWPRPARTLAEFVSRFVNSGGDKYWLRRS